MRNAIASRWRLAAVAAGAMALSWPVTGAAQTVAGQARAVQATVASPIGLTTTTLADTGTLGGPTDARDASQLTGSIPALLSAEVLHATTIGWDDQVASEASMGGLSITIAGSSITADFVQARVIAAQGAAGNRTSSVAGLTINGVPVDVSGLANQTISIPGGAIVINEQAGNAVNAIHIIIDGTADVVIASASASAQ
jgi:hypothetical protein